jgi:hypothetical protein
MDSSYVKLVEDRIVARMDEYACQRADGATSRDARASKQHPVTGWCAAARCVSSFCLLHGLELAVCMSTTPAAALPTHHGHRQAE